MFLLFSSAICADENDDIVIGCNFSNAEFGTVAIQICIKDNQAARAAVSQYPEEVKGIVARCVNVTGRVVHGAWVMPYVGASPRMK